MTQALIAWLIVLVLAGPAWGQRVSPASSGGVTGLTTNSCATTTRLIYLSAASTIDCAPATTDGTDITITRDLSVGRNLLLPATGNVINFDDGDLLLTHSAGLLDLTGGNLQVPALGVGAAPSATAGTIVLASGGGLALNTTPVANKIIVNTGGVIGYFGSNASWGATIGTSVIPEAWAVSNGGMLFPLTDNAYDVGFESTPLRPRNLIPAEPAITAGSGTGVTVNYRGVVRGLWYKVTVASTNCIAAAVTCDVTIGTLPAKTFVKRVFADLTTTYACAATCTTATLSGTLGTTAGGTELLASMDLDAATAQFGDADAELGSLMTAAARTANGALIPGVLGSWSGTTTMTYRITSGTGNLGTGAATNLSQGSITFYVETEKAP